MYVYIYTNILYSETIYIIQLYTVKLYTNITIYSMLLLLCT